MRLQRCRLDQHDDASDRYTALLGGLGRQGQCGTVALQWFDYYACRHARYEVVQLDDRAFRIRMRVPLIARAPVAFLCREPEGQLEASLVRRGDHEFVTLSGEIYYGRLQQEQIVVDRLQVAIEDMRLLRSSVAWLYCFEKGQLRAAYFDPRELWLRTGPWSLRFKAAGRQVR